MVDSVSNQARQWRQGLGVCWFLMAFGSLALTGCGEQDDTPGPVGDPERGKVALRQYACTTCHRIPGIVGSPVWVGPDLTGMGQRIYIAGILANTTENMILWLQNPTSVDPDTAMPDLGVSEAHARDMAAYLGGLK